MSEEAALLEWEAPRLEATVEPAEAWVGESVAYRIVVQHPQEVAVKLPAKPDLTPFELNGVTHEQTPVPGSAGEVVDTWVLELGVYHLDEGTVPSLVLEVVTPDGPAQLTLPTQTVTVRSVTAEQGEGDPRELAPPERVWVDDYSLLYALGIGLGVMLLALLAWRLVARIRRRRAERVVPPPPPQPLEVRTRTALEALRAERLVEQGRHREFYFRLSEIIRGYLGERFGFDAMESTTTELLALLRDRPTPGLDYQRFAVWSEEADLVKFAKHTPDDAEVSRALTEAFAFVDETTAATRPAPAQADAA